VTKTNGTLPTTITKTPEQATTKTTKNQLELRHPKEQSEKKQNKQTNSPNTNKNLPNKPMTKLDTPVAQAHKQAITKTTTKKQTKS
jgi:hypothetical protein